MRWGKNSQRERVNSLTLRGGKNSQRERVNSLTLRGGKNSQRERVNSPGLREQILQEEPTLLTFNSCLLLYYSQSQVSNYVPEEDLTFRLYKDCPYLIFVIIIKLSRARWATMFRRRIWPTGYTRTADHAILRSITNIFKPVGKKPGVRTQLLFYNLKLKLKTVRLQRTQKFI